MSGWNRWINTWGGLGVATLVARWMESLEYQVASYDPTADPAHEDFRGPAIYVFWHEYIPLLFYGRGFCNIAMLVSAHRDAELLSQAARFMGFDTVRGSTQRGGGTALRDLQRKGRYMNLAITPDGPRGPRRRLAPGAIFLASKLQLPLIAIGLGYNRPWRLPTWDRFAIPRLYSRARIILGPQLYLPADLDKDGVEHHRRDVQSLLERLTTCAEDWASSGRGMEGAILAHRERAKTTATCDLSVAPAISIPSRRDAA